MYIDMGVEPKIGVFTPQIIHLFIGFSIIFTIHFGVPLFFGNTHIVTRGNYNHHKPGYYHVSTTNQQVGIGHSLWLEWSLLC